MKIVVIALFSTGLEQLDRGEGLEYLPWLMQSGCYGRLEGVESSAQITDIASLAQKAGLRVEIVGTPFSEAAGDGNAVLVQSREYFRLAREHIADESCDLVLLLEDASTLRREIKDEERVSLFGRWVDDELGLSVGALSDDSALLIVLANETSTHYALVAPNTNVLVGTHDAHLMDLAVTLLELGGAQMPESIEGISLLSGGGRGETESADHGSEEEEIVRQRLEGLGYI
jgi:hypothetical protein